MTPIVQRVRKLIALTGSPNENEARSAAFLACRLIREHGLDVADGRGGGRHSDRADRERSERWERPERPPPEPRGRATRGPYARARHLRGEPRCCECSEPIGLDDACVDADGLPVHGDCIPAGERP
jgi:hypothetical protein